MKMLSTRRLLLLALAISPGVQADCFDRVGQAFSISPLLLEAIAFKESHLNPAAINTANSNNTEDVCMMQVNSIHFSRLKTLGVTRQRLLKEPCTCVATGAWVLHGLFRQYGRSWNTVGMYNTGPSPARQGLRQRYAADVRQIYLSLQKERKKKDNPALLANSDAGEAAGRG